MATDKLVEYVRGILDRDAVSADTLPAARPADAGLETVGPKTVGITPEHRETLRKVEGGQPLTLQERAQLEAVVIPNGLRPAFDVTNDTFEALPETWKEVNAHRLVLESMIKSIGRLNVTGHPALTFVGTAFVVAHDLLLTNRHVAEYFVDGVGATVQFKSGMSGTLDFKQEVGSPVTLPLRIAAPILILDDWDAALLRVDPLPAGVTPLTLSASPPAAIEGRLAVVIGYPAMDPASDLIQQIQIFRGVFDKKRLMPGRLMGGKTTTSYARTVTALGHDCTTLGGNSGSALIDVASKSVVGLHFAGDYLVANYAVPSWELASEAQITAAGVVFT